MEDFTRGDKSICLPVESEEQYREIIFLPGSFRQYVLQIGQKYPELFPTQIEKGFWFHDFSFSLKQELPLRRIKLKANKQVYQLRPDFIMPYMVGKTDEIDKPMYLRHDERVPLRLSAARGRSSIWCAI